MGTEVKLHAAKPAPTEVRAAGEGDTALALAERLGRLAAEAELAERVLAHMGEQRDRAGAARERLERCGAGVDEAERGPGRAPLAVEAVAIESRLTRLRVAASLIKAFAQLRACEAETLEGEVRRSNAAMATGHAAPDSHLVETQAADRAEKPRFRRAS